MNKRHGMHGTRTYETWSSMKRRCQTTSTGNYARYGGIGVSVCPRWQKFDAFLTDMGIAPEGATLDRIDNTKGYEPGNCRWATPLEQAANRRSTLFLTHNGETLPLTEWARRLDLPGALLRKRKARGWDDARVICEPINTQFIRATFERIRAEQLKGKQ